MITIKRLESRFDADLLRRFGAVPTADLADAMGGTGALDHGIRPLFASHAFAGVAVTVLTPPNDNLAPYAALDMVGENDVVVISTSDFTTGATVGDTLLSHYKRRGVAAVVLDGLARDIGGLEAIGVPVYARGLSPNAPQKHGPGHIGFDVVLGGVHVVSGDVVVGDADGVVIVPQGRALSVLEAAEKTSARSAPSDPDALPGWLGQFLQGDGVRRV